MAKKNYTTNADGRSAEDKAMDKFAELMIEKELLIRNIGHFLHMQIWFLKFKIVVIKRGLYYI